MSNNTPAADHSPDVGKMVETPTDGQGRGLEQWLRRHRAETRHRPHPECAAEDFMPWQATNGYEYRYGITEMHACRSLAEALGVEFELTVEDVPKSFAEERLLRERDELRLSLQDINGDRAVLRELLQNAKAERDELKAEVTQMAQFIASKDKQLQAAGFGCVEEALSRLDRLRAENAEQRAALERIERWFGEFPETGRTWDDGSPMSYAAVYGSNGERDFMREIARDAIAKSAE